MVPVQKRDTICTSCVHNLLDFLKIRPFFQTTVMEEGVLSKSNMSISQSGSDSQMVNTSIFIYMYEHVSLKIIFPFLDNY